MIGFVLSAYLSGTLPQNFVPVKSSHVATSSTPADTWLDCKWREKWQSSSSFSGAHSDTTSDHEFDKIYVLSPSKNAFFFYDPKYQYLLIQNATIGAHTILIDDQDHNENMIGESKSERQWSVSRSDMSISVFGQSLTNVRMDDGRISTSQILMNGSGTCVFIDPQPLAPGTPNKF